jgi:hypothetical protein
VLVLVRWSFASAGNKPIHCVARCEFEIFVTEEDGLCRLDLCSNRKPIGRESSANTRKGQCAFDHVVVNSSSAFVHATRPRVSIEAYGTCASTIYVPLDDKGWMRPVNTHPFTVSNAARARMDAVLPSWDKAQPSVDCL